ncbi:hypothetical protein SVI_1941 [Shewanella violacea DSS12]|uniref:Uncharacterized protein n=1 Tax=Shewanella violacea (strain JCM 10179 / CIP 106290 / LMG 19151 / DSS12) TaxID=637905 RepID=D4ZJR3_SHEVD|nr:hypothetical protein SVI_1941 [Shewanella violacea DSS12]
MAIGVIQTLKEQGALLEQVSNLGYKEISVASLNSLRPTHQHTSKKHISKKH